MKDKFKQAYMQSAEIFAELSHATRLKVGAIIVKEGRIISIGYNGMPTGWDNVCEYAMVNGTLKTNPEVLHAESNAITKLAKSFESGEGAALFATRSPCLECAKLIHQSGITEVYYSDHYRKSDGVNFLLKCNIIVEQIK